jgi:hypothetical protein
MLRLQHQRGAEELPGLYNKEHSKPTDPLHSLGKELSVHVRKLSARRIILTFVSEIFGIGEDEAPEFDLTEDSENGG